MIESILVVWVLLSALLFIASGLVWAVERMQSRRTLRLVDRRRHDNRGWKR